MPNQRNKKLNVFFLVFSSCYCWYRLLYYIGATAASSSFSSSSLSFWRCCCCCFFTSFFSSFCLKCLPYKLCKIYRSFFKYIYTAETLIQCVRANSWTETTTEKKRSTNDVFSRIFIDFDKCTRLFFKRFVFVSVRIQAQAPYMCIDLLFFFIRVMFFFLAYFSFVYYYYFYYSDWLVGARCVFVSIFLLFVIIVHFEMRVNVTYFIFMQMLYKYFSCAVHSTAVFFCIFEFAISVLPLFDYMYTFFYLLSKRQRNNKTTSEKIHT